MDITTVAMPNAQLKKRFGLIALKIGAPVAHKIGIEMPLDEGEYSSTTKAVGGKTRTRATPQSSHYAMGRNRLGEQVPVKALPGATVYLEVEDLSRCSEEDVEAMRWACQHPECAGKRWATKDDLARDHGKQKDLIAQANGDPHGQAHVYFGVIEIPAQPERKDDKGKTVSAPTAAVVMIVSDEE
jgi:hypothetical protein